MNKKNCQGKRYFWYERVQVWAMMTYEPATTTVYKKKTKFLVCRQGSTRIRITDASLLLLMESSKWKTNRSIGILCTDQRNYSRFFNSFFTWFKSISLSVYFRKRVPGIIYRSVAWCGVRLVFSCFSRVIRYSFFFLLSYLVAHYAWRATQSLDMRPFDESPPWHDIYFLFYRSDLFLLVSVDFSPSQLSTHARSFFLPSLFFLVVVMPYSLPSRWYQVQLSSALLS